MLNKLSARKWVLAAVALGLAGTAQATVITYETTNVAGNTWQYNYAVSNEASSGYDIEEFALYFDYDLYANLTNPLVATGWDHFVADPAPSFSIDGLYDVYTLDTGISPSTSLDGFSVQFDYLGGETPGSQFFEIIDPFDFSILETGFSELAQNTPIAEPASLLLLFVALAGLWIIPRHRIQQRI